MRQPAKGAHEPSASCGPSPPEAAARRPSVATSREDCPNDLLPNSSPLVLPVSSRNFARGLSLRSALRPVVALPRPRLRLGRLRAFGCGVLPCRLPIVSSSQSGGPQPSAVTSHAGCRSDLRFGSSSPCPAFGRDALRRLAPEARPPQPPKRRFLQIGRRTRFSHFGRSRRSSRRARTQANKHGRELAYSYPWLRPRYSVSAEPEPAVWFCARLFVSLTSSKIPPARQNASRLGWVANSLIRIYGCAEDTPASVMHK